MRFSRSSSRRLPDRGSKFLHPGALHTEGPVLDGFFRGGWKRIEPRRDAERCGCGAPLSRRGLSCHSPGSGE
jgi:hypothetical protein